MARRLTALLLALLLAAALPSCGTPQKKRFEAEFLTLFDTVTRIVGYAESKEEFTEWARRLRDGLEEYHRLYDIYGSYEGINNLKTVNDNAGVAPVQVDRRIIDLLLLSREMYGRTDGRVNVAMGSVLALWHDCREAGADDPASAALPSREELEEAALHTDISRLVIDEAASTVFLEDPAMRLDVGAIAKGYAVEQVCRKAEAEGFSAGLVSLGGNIRVIGEKEGGEPWKVGVQDPADPEQMLLTLSLSGDVSLVTSGTYQRYYTVDGRRYHHIIDPQTLQPSAYFESVSILCADSGRADALSTAVFNMAFDQGKAFVEEQPDVEAMWVFQDGRQEYSKGFEAYRSK